MIFSKHSEADIYLFDCKFKKEFFSNVQKYQEDPPGSESGCAFVAVYIHAIQNALSGLLIYVELSMKRPFTKGQSFWTSVKISKLQDAVEQLKFTILLII